ncbi:MAG: TIGR03560 family F420-dependent LLM class oxidoreductase [Actinophytocola sp.]|uniref:LLM class F420-dependent oxidoreductase n=1 Tax=Actinophytocola sp. TaxID=1872138 RepID=UPI00132761F7|nr:LLM class F420-dependent oxidoreductase [Actinophytocola sp.]MPZ86346.1 TIGR03560 family F420-dependent LLM class oxidoreductase [Actinophytocola sp.]
MKIGLHPTTFSWPGGPARMGQTLGDIVDRAEAAGIHSFWPMDHFFQIPIAGKPDDPMLESWATVAWAAGRTRTLRFGTLVTGVHHRHPGLLAKFATTLDVLSGGRAWLGIGAGWNEEESRGLGIPFPPLAERFERLEETLEIVHRMFDGDSTAYVGKHYQLERPLNVPGPVRRPPILVGGGGERKTLRLVARYADACNLFEQMDLRHKFDVLRAHCDTVGRDYDAIVRTTFGLLGEDRDLGRAVERFAALAEQGVDLSIVNLPEVHDPAVFDFLADLVGELEPIGRPTPAPLR